MQKEVKTLHSSEFIKDGVEHNKNHEVPNIGDTFVHEEKVWFHYRISTKTVT